MSNSNAQTITSKKARLMDQVRFIGALAKSPKTVGAVAPTASETADLMASHITYPNTLPVLELGPGTGAITAAILRRGVSESDLFAVEYDPKFCRKLRAKLPRANIIEGNAFDLDSALAAHDSVEFDCVVSGLPLLNFEPEMRRRFLEGALKRVPKGRPLIQFSYGIRPPIEPENNNTRIERSRWIFKNLPPARVWTYSYI